MISKNGYSTYKLEKLEIRKTRNWTNTELENFEIGKIRKTWNLKNSTMEKLEIANSELEKLEIGKIRKTLRFFLF